MEDNGDQTGRAVFKGNPALRPARLKRFRKEVEAGRVPSLESMLRTRTYDVVNPVPYFVNEYLEVDNIRLVSSGNPNPEDPDFPLSP